MTQMYWANFCSRALYLTNWDLMWTCRETCVQSPTVSWIKKTHLCCAAIKCAMDKQHGRAKAQDALYVFLLNPTSACVISHKQSSHLSEGESTDPDKDPSPLTIGCLPRWMLFSPWEQRQSKNIFRKFLQSLHIMHLYFVFQFLFPTFSLIFLYGFGCLNLQTYDTNSGNVVQGSSTTLSTGEELEEHTWPWSISTKNKCNKCQFVLEAAQLDSKTKCHELLPSCPASGSAHQLRDPTLCFNVVNLDLKCFMFLFKPTIQQAHHFYLNTADI